MALQLPNVTVARHGPSEAKSHLHLLPCLVKLEVNATVFWSMGKAINRFCGEGQKKIEGVTNSHTLAGKAKVITGFQLWGPGIRHTKTNGYAGYPKSTTLKMCELGAVSIR
jgi:hypothetical protein